MPNRKPYSRCPGSPLYKALYAGDMLYRLHRDRFNGNQFNFAKAESPYEGGRFDSFDGSYGYLYAGDTPEVCFDETLLRDKPGDDAGVRTIPRRDVKDRLLSKLVLGHETRVLDLSCTDGLVAMGQDQWLTESDADYYPHTRVWAGAMREWAPDAAGFVWRARHNRDDLSYIFFSDVAATSSRPDAAKLLTVAEFQSVMVGRTRRQLNQWLRRRRCRLS